MDKKSTKREGRGGGRMGTDKNWKRKERKVKSICKCEKTKRNGTRRGKRGIKGECVSVNCDLCGHTKVMECSEHVFAHGGDA